MGIEQTPQMAPATSNRVCIARGAASGNTLTNVGSNSHTARIFVLTDVNLMLNTLGIGGAVLTWGITGASVINSRNPGSTEQYPSLQWRGNMVVRPGDQLYVFTNILTSLYYSFEGVWEPYVLGP